MTATELTFNDLPKVVGELCERIASMENLLRDNLNRQSEPKENLHVPMTVQEACTYLKMPVSTFYYKIKKDSIPVIKQGKYLYIYRDELDKWLEKQTFRLSDSSCAGRSGTSDLVSALRRDEEYSFVNLLSQRTKARQNDMPSAASANSNEKRGRRKMAS